MFFAASQTEFVMMGLEEEQRCRLYVLGDIHADFGALNQFVNKKQPDIILQCGDFGWWPHRHGTEKNTRNRRFDQYAVKPGGQRFSGAMATTRTMTTCRSA
jgi:hypothetical protein